MEQWFIFAVLSAVFAGIQSTVQSLAIRRNISTVLLNSYGTLISSFCALVLFFYYNEKASYSMFGYLLIIVAGTVYMFGTIARSRSLRGLDTGIVFPIYKSLTLLGTVFFGYVLYSDSISILNWLGILLAVCVPKLLVEAHHHRKKHKSFLQKHIKNTSWMLLYIASMAGIFSTLVTNYTLDFFESVLLVTAISHFFGGLFGLSQQIYNYWGNLKMQLLDLRHPHHHLFLLAIVAGLSQFISFYFMLRALTLGQVTNVYAINSAYLVFPILVSFIYYHEKIGYKKILAIFISLVSVLLIK